jgi:peptide/nickel transport system permease protein
LATGVEVLEKQTNVWGASQRELIWKRFRRRKLGMVGLIVLLLLLLSVIVIPIIYPYQDVPTFNPVRFATLGATDPNTGQVYLLGTDYLGRDEFPRLFQAGRMSLSVALFSTLGILIIGSIVGATAGFFGGWVDNVLMRITDFLSVLPLLPAYLILIRLLGWTSGPRVSGGDTGIFVTLVATATVFTIFGWMPLSRMVRASVLTLRTLPFIESARALGAGSSRILFRHLLPNSLAPILVVGTFALGDFIILEALLTYFGVGLLDPPTPSWGNMLSGTQNYVWSVQTLNPFEDIHATLILAPSLMILLAVLSINYVGDALREALDPHAN